MVDRDVGVSEGARGAARGREPIPSPEADPLVRLHRQWWEMLWECRDPIILVDAHTHEILEANPALERRFQWSREDLLGRHLSTLLRQVGLEEKGLGEVGIPSRGGGSIEGLELCQGDGGMVRVDVQARPVLFGAREALQMTILPREDTEVHLSQRTAAFFQDLSQTVPLLLDFDQVLDRIVERFARAMAFHGFALGLVEEGELKRLTLYTSEEPLEIFLREMQERIIGALLHLGIQVTPTRLQYSIRERPWIPRALSGGIASHLLLPIPLDGARGVQGVGGLFNLDPQAFRSEETALFSTFVGGIASSYLVYHSYREIEAQSNTDPLTGLANRRRFFRELEHLAEITQRQNRPLSLIMIDIDYFKRLNDRYGHKAGDEVLRQVAVYLKHGVREQDLVVRYGGEEFLILLPWTDLSTAGEIAERIRSDIEAMEILIPPHASIRLTVSLGISSVRAGESTDQVLRRVDRAMYRAKEGGRNRVAFEE